MSDHILPFRAYLNVFLALLLLTALTTAVAYVDFGTLNDVIAMAIAGTKAALVIAVFMHVRYQSPLVRIFAAAGFVWLVIFFVLILADYDMRLPVQGWTH